MYNIEKCLLCNRKVKGNLGISIHLKNYHNEITLEEYLVKFFHNNIWPTCLCGCGQKTLFRKAGVFSFSTFVRGHKNKEIKEKIETKRLKTCLEKYNTKCALQDENVKQKTINTTLEKYGVDHFSKSPLYKEKVVNTSLKRYGSEYFQQSSVAREINRKSKLLSLQEILNICKIKQYEPLFSMREYKGNRQILSFRCEKHNIVFDTQMFYIQQQDGSQCPSCKHQGFSMEEKEVVDFIKSIYSGEVVENSKQIISPYELDIWIPEKQLGIEYCGLYWHSSANPNFKKNLHRDKAILMQQKGYKLFLFFSDEWKNKRHLVEQMIKYRLGLIKQKIYARKCVVKEYNKASELKEFFQNNHIDGYSNSTKGFALLYNDIVMAAMTLRTNHQGEVEICRFATNCEYVVTGAGSKLISLLPRPIITFSNNRLSSGKIYKDNGFEEITKTISPSYYYTNFETRIWRYKCRRLNPPKISQEDFDKFPTEVSQALGGIFSRKIFGDETPLYRIEDAGHKKYILK